MQRNLRHTTGAPEHILGVPEVLMKQEVGEHEAGRQTQILSLGEREINERGTPLCCC
jgi:hypothetical protein